VLIEREDGTATYEFRAAPPPAGAVPGPEPTRVIVGRRGARSRRPAGLRSITVIARSNRRTVERR
jgi:hypothetical protein